VERVGVESFRWRVVALGAEGSVLAATPWRAARFGAGDAGAPPPDAATPGAPGGNF
jgi:hypothetical protein